MKLQDDHYTNVVQVFEQIVTRVMAEQREGQETPMVAKSPENSAQR